MVSHSNRHGVAANGDLVKTCVGIQLIYNAVLVQVYGKVNQLWYMRACLLSRVQLFATPWAVATQTPLSVGILQARILEWFAIFYSGGSSQSRDWTRISRASYIGR